MPPPTTHALDPALTTLAASPTRTGPPRIDLAARSSVSVLAIGGQHQFAHIVPVACELERRTPGSVTVFTCTADDGAAIARIAQSLALPTPRIVEMILPSWLTAMLPGNSAKLARLARYACQIARARVVLCAERTSTILRRTMRRFPPLLHIPHGAGDRGVGFEKRFACFDDVLVAGHKDRDRLVSAGTVRAERCHVTGPIKLAALFRKGIVRPKLFANDRPVLLYNPHFASRFRSFEAFLRKLVDAVVADGRYNLIVAPHVRLASTLSEDERAAAQALAVEDRVLIDMGSARCCDMTYTLAADLYIGDVSSQVYEYLVLPRPCLFVDPHGVDWEYDANYAMWHFGPVIAPEKDPIAAIDRAFADHPAYVRWQKQRMQYAIDGISWDMRGQPMLSASDPIDVAADRVGEWLAAQAPDRARSAA
ncbi:hypothetical protein [Croceicoccus naphthovorans]|uniref:hypothetical protein n=1 Tax=Croceicoccus naphthovorans TaxID=1348774 RepID=UPI00069DC66B|nr:hypothetical protein [Croceicoccus naphthovorans]MBB3989309.1 hypothetical protein [Croceicoccus naphthovorans]